MINFLLRRFVIGTFTLLLITFLVYGLIRAMPGDPTTTDPANMDPSRQISVEEMEKRKAQYGLDRHWTIGYLMWLGKVVQLDLGQSYQRKRPVADEISARIMPTLLLTVTSLICTYVLAIPLGLFVTVKSGTLVERATSTLLYMLYSLPSFVAALLLQLFLAVKLEWLPLFNMVSNDHETLSTVGKMADIAQHAFLPIVCFTYGSLAYYARFIKANMEEVVRQDYIRTARAKGCSPLRIVFHHAFRNTLIPLITLLGLTLPTLLSGAIILEQIFTWPGMGSLFFEAILLRDYPVIMGLVLIFAALTLLGQLLADVLYAFADPRVSYS